MNNTLLPSINIPCTLFETISLFDDYSADDMQYGDMVEQDFLSLGLSDISAKVDPYRLIKYHFPREGANKRGNSSRLTQSFHFFMFEPIFSPVNALNQPI